MMGLLWRFAPLIRHTCRRRLRYQEAPGMRQEPPGAKWIGDRR
jgi:hypothetical protein